MQKQDVIDLIRDAGFGFLATAEDGQPRVRAIAPYLTEESTLLAALICGSRSISQIQKNPKIEFCFVDRRMSYCRLAGNAKIPTDKAKRQLIWDNMPMLRQYFESAEDQNMVLVEIKVTEAEAMTQADRQPQKIDF